MDMNQYQFEILKWDGGANASDTDRQIICSLGLAGEAGEVADLMKKRLAHPHKTVTQDMFLLELGDVLWYLAAMADSLGFSLEEVASANLVKIKTRYPNGFPIKRV